MRIPAYPTTERRILLVRKEIGSEFHFCSAKTGKNTFDIDTKFKYKRFIQSGRTGLSLIADELSILDKKIIALPDYCCASMVYPFFNKGFEVVFYHIDEDVESAYNLIKNVDAVLLMDYFGFIRDFSLKLAQKAKQLNKKIIVDATQAAFSKSGAYSYADYLLISYRKWSDILCGTVYSNKEFSGPLYKSEYKEYTDIWKKASILKKKYLEDEQIDKKEFLNLYASANHLLECKYEKFSCLEEDKLKLENIDSYELISKRRNNAKYIIDRLKEFDNENITLMFDNLNENDCPLFVPVLVNENMRDLVRKKMAEKEIYCPAHWPIDKKYPFSLTDYHIKEISLICDQRYDLNDMKRQTDELINILK